MMKHFDQQRLRHRKSVRTLWPKSGLAAAALAACSMGHAIDFGPNGMFSLTGFAEATLGRVSNSCIGCQVVSNTEGKQKSWADAIISGHDYSTMSTTFWQVQPYLGVKHKFANGWELSGLLSQRWIDYTTGGQYTQVRYGGKVDVPNYWYQKNIAVSHEDYGSLRAGAMTTRAWSVADYPYGTNLALSSAWSATGAGYGMLTNAYRYTSRPLDVAQGDLVIEATYDFGDTKFQIHKPSFLELYTQYHRGDLVIDAMYQDAKNGGGGAWGKAPFAGLVQNASDDSAYLSGNHQSIAMLMARYQLNSQLEVSGGVRRNRWSGANALQLASGQWSNMFNVDWNTSSATIGSPGYGASSFDYLLGTRYRREKFIYLAGLVYYSTAKTDNPSNRGQHNSAVVTTAGVQYQQTNDLKYYLTLGRTHYTQRGLSPMSMPGNADGNGIDARVSRDGNWINVGAILSF